MKAPQFAYARPGTLDELYDLLAAHGDDARILAGGQSLMPALAMRLSQPRLLVDINSIPGLDGISVSAGLLRIGALARHRDVGASAEVERHAPLVHQAIPHIAHVAIRNRGTLGGSLALADPAAELPACMLALDATLVAGSKRGERRIPAREFFRALYETALEPGEVLLAAEIPAQAPAGRSVFMELSRRHGDYAIVGLAAHAQVRDGAVAAARLAFFGVGATAVLATRAATALEGRSLDAASIAAAQAALAEDLDPLPDLYNSRDTKLHLARVLAGRVLAAMGA